MATFGNYKDDESFKKITSRIRTTIETAFWGNNVFHITTPREAYELAKRSPGTVELTGMPVYEPEWQGLPTGCNVLLFNDGAVVGRCAAARRIIGEPNVSLDEYATKLREAVYNMRYKDLYATEAVIGLEKDFMVRAHLLIPKGHENMLYNWVLNFQYINKIYNEMYKESKKYVEGDIYILADPDWKHPDHPLGLSLFDPEHNCAAVLGMRYFGELKKGTLTLAWGTAVRNGFASCHGGLKRYNLSGGRSFVAAVFGLSGSGKSTITHARHQNRYDITVLHDDAFVINLKDRYSIALEPSYFDKVQDYPMGCDDNKFIVTLQNCGAVRNENGLVCAVTEDLRNGNGRAIKSKLWSPTRVDRIDEPINAIFWLMKDPTIPPVLKLTDPVLGATMGATLATRRTTAERLAPGVDPNALVFEPYANPFRTYPLSIDYNRFKALFDSGVNCYILNTGDFMGKKVQPCHTLSILESIIEGHASFKPFGPLRTIEIMHIDDFSVSLNDVNYKKEIFARIKDRIAFVKSRESERGGVDKLPREALETLQSLTRELGYPGEN
ncbi:MAG: phosphoenolpyruvate carboxykinase (ATP) [Aminobacterium sp.]|jgi:phosphoenolpyruvate carboxykinase (ATP)|uniref:phosphoenolpyruvate carboxykinase (ATP) n=1 Tax=unclassified Aminobacterium TaxID=2685012 RepID=UPI001BCC6C20|nr:MULTISPECIES: phosphoenolpyruvate carboxykinase (ATP) [unclassified Aminobacterium]MDD2205953.1 phosphoenolpyruvate carboxykinase (ATP) [Aminobacterium sp.]MDD3425920.1 phosphoenolpyruvate carboxykinase (ATP) [Aminobacterium sp.]MDD3707581.1 phosphoenolpyruvate carboxykinase (ATP) [Aminobacterium sp.]MDD4227890.1 phosphoenolpyruvate carboxykinase (ATP) [Aminobacterium sp.]MDD4550670.1 phosphoenolpyruvate carboxykinase (ATP) [Aminobacterium sp.]